jgi:hypothetical protein
MYAALAASKGNIYKKKRVGTLIILQKYVNFGRKNKSYLGEF